jgi:hypothetical protein
MSARQAGELLKSRGMPSPRAAAPRGTERMSFVPLSESGYEAFASVLSSKNKQRRRVGKDGHDVPGAKRTQGIEPPTSDAERQPLNTRLTRERPSKHDEPYVAWPVGHSVWCDPSTRQLAFALQCSRAILGAIRRVAALSSRAFTLRAEHLTAFITFVGFVLGCAAGVAWVLGIVVTSKSWLLVAHQEDQVSAGEMAVTVPVVAGLSLNLLSRRGSCILGHHLSLCPR